MQPLPKYHNKMCHENPRRICSEKSAILGNVLHITRVARRAVNSYTSMYIYYIRTCMYYKYLRGKLVCVWGENKAPVSLTRAVTQMLHRTVIVIFVTFTNTNVHSI